MVGMQSKSTTHEYVCHFSNSQTQANVSRSPMEYFNSNAVQFRDAQAIVTSEPFLTVRVAPKPHRLVSAIAMTSMSGSSGTRTGRLTIANWMCVIGCQLPRSMWTAQQRIGYIRSERLAQTSNNNPNSPNTELNRSLLVGMGASEMALTKSGFGRTHTFEMTRPKP